MLDGRRAGVGALRGRLRCVRDAGALEHGVATAAGLGGFRQASLATVAAAARGVRRTSVRRHRLLVTSVGTSGAQTNKAQGEDDFHARTSREVVLAFGPGYSGL